MNGVDVFGRTRAHGLVGRFGWARGSVVRGVRLGRDACAHGRVHGSVVMHVRIVHGLNFMDDCGWLIATRNHATKSKRHASKIHATKSGDAKFNWERGSRENSIYMFTFFSLVFFLSSSALSHWEDNNLSYLHRKNSFLAGKIVSVKEGSLIFISYPL